MYYVLVDTILWLDNVATWADKILSKSVIVMKLFIPSCWMQNMCCWLIASVVILLIFYVLCLINRRNYLLFNVKESYKIAWWDIVLVLLSCSFFAIYSVFVFQVLKFLWLLPLTITMGMAFAVSVKWQKELFPAVEIDTSQPPLVFKCQLYDLTGVPPERQKIMVKGGLLKVTEAFYMT